MDHFHNTWFQSAVDMTKEVGLEEPSDVQGKQFAIKAATPEEYYRRALTIPFLEHLITELQERFTAHVQKASSGLRLVPSIMRNSSSNNEEKVKEFINMYESDLPNPLTVNAELYQRN